MADCKYILPDGRELNEANFKAYLLNGGLKELKDLGFIKINVPQRVLNVAVQKAYQETDEDTTLNESGKKIFRYYDNAYKSGFMSFDQVVMELGSAAERQSNPNIRAKYQAVIKKFADKHMEKLEQEEAELAPEPEPILSESDFDKRISSMKIGLSDTELTVYESTKRITLPEDIDLMDDLSLLQSNDQVRAAFRLTIAAEQMENLADMFEIQYGKNYLREMQKYVEEAAKDDSPIKTESGISVAVALNLRIEKLQQEENSSDRKAYLKSIQEQNTLASQKLGTKASLAMNTLRLWSNQSQAMKKMALGIDPDIRRNKHIIDMVLAGETEISDELALQFQEDTMEAIPDEAEPQPTPEETKKMGVIARLSAAAKARAIKVKSAQELKKDIEQQIKNCK